MNLTPAERERLEILAEECAEVVQAVTKILRHGYESNHPSKPDGYANRVNLEMECGDVRALMILMCEQGDMNKESIHEYAKQKRERLKFWTHHQGGIL